MAAEPAYQEVRAPIRLPRLHQSIASDRHRFGILAAGRGFAKTGILLAHGMRNMSKTYYTPYGEILPNRIMYVAPTMGEAISIAWNRAKAMYEPLTDGKPNESRHEIPLLNNGLFMLRGGKKPDTLRGDYLTDLLLDEAAFFEPEGMTVAEMYQKIFRPMLSKVRPGGEMMAASSPNGHDWFYEMWSKAQTDKYPNMKAWQYRSLDGPFITPAEVEAAKRDMTLEAWQQEYEALFIASSGRIYYKFRRETHLKTVSFVPELTIEWFWDFNVQPCVHSGLAHIHKGKAYVFDEICIGETPDTVREFMERYPASKVKAINIYGDFTGSISTTGTTDYQMMEQMLVARGYPRPEICVYGGNPIERDRTNNVNRMLENAYGQVSLYINHNNCPRLVADLEHVKRSEKTGKIDKGADPNLTHISDGLGYFLYVAAPPTGLRERGEKSSGHTVVSPTGWWV
jgi:hypothetical protein